MNLILLLSDVSCFLNCYFLFALVICVQEPLKKILYMLSKLMNRLMLKLLNVIMLFIEMPFDRYVLLLK